MNLYGSQIWRYNDKTTRSFYTCWRKAIRRLYNIPYRTHNILVHYIINSYPIDVVLEKRCIKYIWNLINSGCKLHADIVFLSMDNTCIQLLVKTCDILCTNINLAPMIGICHFLF